MFDYLDRNHRLLMVALFIWALGEGLWYSNLRQLYLVELGAGEVQVGLALAIEAIARGSLPIPAGYLSDRFDRRTIMLASWFLGVVGVIAVALARSWQLAVPGLVIYAMSAFAAPSLSAFALESIEDHSVPGIFDRVLTALFAAYPAGLIISPAVGGLLADAFSIRTCLWISAGLFVLSTGVALLTRPTSPQAGAIEHSNGGPLWRNRQFVTLCIYFLLAFMVLYVGYQLLPNFLQEVRGFSYATIGLMFSLASVGTVVVNLAVGRMSPRWGFVAALAICWLALLGVWRIPSADWAAPAFVALGAFYTVKTLSTAAVARVVAPRNQGLAFGLMETIFSLALAGAAASAGRLYGLTSGHALPFEASLAIVPLMLVAWFAVRPHAAEPSPLAPLPEGEG